MDWFPKQIALDDVTKHSEPTIQLVRPADVSVPHVKVASEALDYIKNVKPIQDKTIILVLAMTAGEYYGANRNGDGWNEGPVKAGPVHISPEEGLTHHYKSFETNANVFKHHVNKDPNKRLGKVLKAFYNWPMHRVELLLALDNNRAEDIVQRIHRDEFPAVSMGCKIKYDVCSICGNKAPNRSKYCDHARYRLGKYEPDGRQNLVWNPNARFFDISIVRRPADRVGFMMKKVANDVYEVKSSAEWGEQIAGLQSKMGIARKLSVMNKVINGGAAAAKEDDGDTFAVREFANEVAHPSAATTPPLDDDTIREMVKHNPSEVLSTLADMGILLTTPEFIKYYMEQSYPGLEIPQEVLGRAAGLQQHVLDILSQNPELLESISDSGFMDIRPNNVSPELVQKFMPLLEKRSQHDRFVKSRLISALLYKSAELGPGQGNWDLLEVFDPESGKTYTTTRAAAESSRAFNARLRRESSLRDVLGSGALLSGAYKVLGHEPTGASHQAAQAAFARPMLTTSGEKIPFTTEMSLKRASLHLANDRPKTVQRAKVAGNLFDASFDVVSRWLGEAICP